MGRVYCPAYSLVVPLLMACCPAIMDSSPRPKKHKARFHAVDERGLVFAWPWLPYRYECNGGIGQYQQ